MRGFYIVRLRARASVNRPRSTVLRSTDAVACYSKRMCRNIRPLFNFDPPATDEEVRAAAVQFVRKISGFTKPSHTNADVFEQAVDEISATARRLVDALKTSAPPRDREEVAQRARARAAERFGVQ